MGYYFFLFGAAMVGLVVAWLNALGLWDVPTGIFTVSVVFAALVGIVLVVAAFQLSEGG